MIVRFPKISRIHIRLRKMDALTIQKDPYALCVNGEAIYYLGSRNITIKRSIRGTVFLIPSFRSSDYYYDAETGE